MLLQIGDGYTQRVTERVQAEVRRLQEMLDIHVDGKFGPDTEEAVLEFQQDNGLVEDGVVGPNTWRRLESVHEADENRLQDFRGDLGWVHAREGHAGHPYWPGGASGVTLDPGFDLGHVDQDLFERAYEKILTEKEKDMCRSVFGLTGSKAKKALNSTHSELRDIIIPYGTAEMVFPFVATPYWEGIVDRFPSLKDSNCPPQTQTALLSISFNRGYDNPDLEVFRDDLESGDCQGLAETIDSMQQDHPVTGVRKRRRLEANLIQSGCP